jgi:hypothetical protein
MATYSLTRPPRSRSHKLVDGIAIAGWVMGFVYFVIVLLMAFYIIKP